ncbi:MAG: lysophospholipid acyltransferase family protein [Betaproteobacteria bacterium]|nr:lysophospholipid acyltransferase family protein [Betaproteobacteria bacterium]
MLEIVLRPLAWLPLRWLHVLGAGIGWLVYLLSSQYSARLDQNLRLSGLFPQETDYRRVRRRAIAEAGKITLEVLAVWLKPPSRVMRYFREVRNYDLIEKARDSGRGVVLLTPHLGCFEIAGFYFGQKLPLTVLYRPPRKRWLEALMVRGRKRGQTKLAATDLAGVRKLLRALRNGEAVGMLPDQAPQFGDGVWAPFFGRPAFTMTLTSRLRRATGAAAFMVFAERLPKGEGYCLHIEQMHDPVQGEVELNRAVERAIVLRPEQYLWGYDRYKVPRAVAPPQSDRVSIEP